MSNDHCKSSSVSSSNVPSKKVRFATPLFSIMNDVPQHYLCHNSKYNSVNELISSTSDVFTSMPGKFPGLFSLDVDLKCKPVAIPSRRVPHRIKAKYQLFLKELCKLGIIAKCSFPKGWISPVVLL